MEGFDQQPPAPQFQPQPQQPPAFQAPQPPMSQPAPPAASQSSMSASQQPPVPPVPSQLQNPGQPPAPAVAPQPQPQPQPQPAFQPQPQPQPQSQPSQTVRHRVHHSYVWLGGLQAAFAVLVALIVSGASSVAGLLAEGGMDGATGALTATIAFGAGLLLFAVVIGLVLLFQWWSYRHLYYELAPEEFNLYSGIFNKKRVHVPYQRIQSVDQRATLLQRIFGVCTVSIDTAGGSSNKAVMVPYVRKTQAEELRRELFARKQHLLAAQASARFASPGSGSPAVPGSPVAAQPAFSAGNVLDAPAEIWQDVRGVFGGVGVDTGRVTYEYGLSNKELLFTGLSNNTAFVVVVVGILGALMQLLTEVLPMLAGSESVVSDMVAAGVRSLGGSIAAALAVGIVGLAAFVWGVSALATCVAYGGFKARRRDRRIEVEYGLLQHQFQGVDVDRVQSVIVRQSFVRRLLGYCELSLGKIDAASEGSSNQQKSLSQHGVVIHPFVKLDRVSEILAGIVPEFAGVPADNVPVAPVALRRAVIRRGVLQGTGFWLAAIVAVGQVVANLMLSSGNAEEAFALSFVNMGAAVAYVLCLALFALDVVGAVLWFRGSGFAYNDRFMQVSNGGLSRETVSFPRKKIQFGYTRANPFQRRANTATLCVRTAAGVGGTTVALVDAWAEDAQAWLEWLLPRRKPQA